MLTYKTLVESTKFRCKKRLCGLKAMAEKSIEQRHLLQLYQNVILIVIDYALGVTALSQSCLLKLNRVKHKAVCYFWEEQKKKKKQPKNKNKNAAIDVIYCLLDLPSTETRFKVEKVKTYLKEMQNPKNPLHDAVKEEEGCSPARGKSWMSQAK